jgi:NADPH:quinone reductase-like Zn-dependent oxidoreductase
VVANTVHGKTAEQSLGKVKQRGTFASVTGVPDNAKDCPSIRCVAFVSRQDPKTLLYMASAVKDGKLNIPVAKKLPLKETRGGHTMVEKGAGERFCWSPEA